MGIFNRNGKNDKDENLVDISQIIDEDKEPEDDRWSVMKDDTWMDQWKTAPFKINSEDEEQEEHIQEEWEIPVSSDGNKAIGFRKKKKRRKKRYILKFFILLMLIAGIYMFLTSSIFDIKSIVVNDCRYHTKEQILEKSKVKIGDNMFKLSIRKASAELLKEPYIKEAVIKRKPPSMVEISIVERREFATVLLGKKYVTIDPDGMILSKSEVVPAVPLIEGIKIEKAKIGQALIAESNSRYSSIMSVLRSAEENEIAVKKIKVDSSNLKVYVFDSLYFVGTPKNLNKNMKNISKVLRNMATQNIVRGTLKVTGGNTFPYSPIVEDESQETPLANPMLQNNVTEPAINANGGKGN